MSTTGTGTGSDFSGVNDVLKMRYEPVLQNLIVSESEVFDLFTTVEHFAVQDGPDGKQINISHLFNAGGAAGFMPESGYVMAAQLANAKQSNITIKQIAGVCELSGRAMRRMKDSQAAIADWADEALPLVVDRLVHHKDRALIGTGTGIVGRVNGTPTTGSTAVNAAFGVTGLEGAINLFMEGDSVRFASDAAGTSLRTNAAVIQSQNFGGDAMAIDVVPTSGASGDYIFIGDVNQNGSGTVEPMGLEGHIDDGTNVATYQGLSRTTYPKLKAQILDTSSAGFDQTLSEDAVINLATKQWKWGKGRPDVLLASYSAATSFWKAMKGDRILNDPRGQFSGGVDLKSGLSVVVGGQALTIRACRKVPDSRAYLIQKDSLKMYRIGSGRWDDTDGSMWNRVVTSTGRRDAFFAVYIDEFETAGLAPLRNGKFTNLAAA